MTQSQPQKVERAVKLLTEILDDFDREMNNDIEAEDFNIGQDEQIEVPTESFRTLLADHSRQSLRIASLEKDLTIIANASFAVRNSFGGRMSEVTRVFEEINRVARLHLTTPERT